MMLGLGLNLGLIMARAGVRVRFRVSPVGGQQGGLELGLSKRLGC